MIATVMRGTDIGKTTARVVIVDSAMNTGDVTIQGDGYEARPLLRAGVPLRAGDLRDGEVVIINHKEGGWHGDPRGNRASRRARIRHVEKKLMKVRP